MSANTSEFDGKFVVSYSKLLTKVWGDEKELSALLADPTGYATAAGLPVAGGHTVEIDRTPREGLPLKTDLVEAWTARPGVHVLRVPPASPIDIAELSDAELDSVAAGNDNNNIIVIAV